MNSVCSIEKMDLDYEQRHFQHAQIKPQIEVKYLSDQEDNVAERHFDEPDQWNRKLKHRHKNRDPCTEENVEPCVLTAMLHSESTV